MTRLAPSDRTDPQAPGFLQCVDGFCTPALPHRIFCRRRHRPDRRPGQGRRPRTVSRPWPSPTCPTCSVRSNCIHRRVKKGFSPSSGPMSGSSPKSRARHPPALLLLIQNRQGYLRLCELLGEAWTAPGAAHACLGALGFAGGQQRRPDLPVRGGPGGHWPGPDQWRCGQGRGPGHPPGRDFPRALLHRTAACRSPHQRDPHPRRRAPGRQAGLAGGGHAPDPVLDTG